MYRLRCTLNLGTPSARNAREKPLRLRRPIRLPWGTRSNPKVEAAFESACGRWRHCDWPVEFGPSRLKLTGINAKAAKLLANATAGEESRQWAAAAAWLSAVEKAALDALLAGKKARNAASSNDWDAAIGFAQEACLIEKAYRPVTVWGELLMVIRAKSLRVDAPSAVAPQPSTREPTSPNPRTSQLDGQ